MKKAIVKQFAHLIAGLLILAHGFEAFEKRDTKLSIIFLAFALLILIIAGIHLWLEKQIKKIGAAFFMLEAFALYYSAWQYKVGGNKLMLIVSVLVASLYVWYAIYLFSSRSRKHRKRRSRSSRSRPENLNEDSAAD
jgi:4-hydroxybenzoate polyprenyltransferase